MLVIMRINVSMIIKSSSDRQTVYPNVSATLQIKTTYLIIVIKFIFYLLVKSDWKKQHTQNRNKFRTHYKEVMESGNSELHALTN